MPSLSTGNHILRPEWMGSGNIVDAIPTSTGNVWMQVNCLRHKDDSGNAAEYYVRYQSSAPAGRIVVLDAGPMGKFTDTNTRGITIQHGQTIRFKRTGRNSYDIISPSGAVGRSSSFNIPSRRVLLLGQSIAQQWEYMPAPGAFMDRMAELGDTTSTSFIHMATGGSAALKEYRPDAARYWFDYDLNQSGPLLSNVCSDVSGLPSSEMPTHVLWVQGEQDSGVYVGDTEAEDDEFIARYYRAVFKVLSLSRAYINPANRYAIPAFIQILGPRPDGERRGMPLVRAAQWDVINTADINANAGAVSPMDLPLGEGVHPSPEGYGTLGRLTAEAFFNAA